MNGKKWKMISRCYAGIDKDSNSMRWERVVCVEKYISRYTSPIFSSLGSKSSRTSDGYDLAPMLDTNWVCNQHGSGWSTLRLQAAIRWWWSYPQYISISFVVFEFNRRELPVPQPHPSWIFWSYQVQRWSWKVDTISRLLFDTSTSTDKTKRGIPKDT